MALLNVLEERDIQVRGYQLRLPLDLLLVASANPEDYTNRGRIITPLKDRFGAEIRTHYPLDLELETGADPAGGRPGRRRCRSTCWRCWPGSPAAVRESPAVDPRSGVSARFAIAAAETVAAVRAAPRRPAAARRERGRPGRRHRVGDQHAARQGRVRERRGGPGDRGPRPPAADRHRRDVPGPAGRAGPVRLHRPGRRGRDHRDRRAGRAPTSCCARSAPCRGWPRCSTGSAWATRRARGEAAAGVEFVLEGLHLTRRLAKDAHRRRPHRSTAAGAEHGRQPVPVRRVAGRARPARPAVRRAGRGRRGRRARCWPAAACATRCATCCAAARDGRRGLDDLRGPGPPAAPGGAAPGQPRRRGDPGPAAARPGARRRARRAAPAATTTTPGSPRRCWTTCPARPRGRCEELSELRVGQRRGPRALPADPRRAARSEVRGAAVRRACATRCAPPTRPRSRPLAEMMRRPQRPARPGTPAARTPPTRSPSSCAEHGEFFPEQPGERRRAGRRRWPAGRPPGSG